MSDDDRAAPCGCGKPIDVDRILASLGSEYDDPGDNPWGSANLDTGEWVKDV